MKIGFLFGSFDPIHIGHLYMITSALEYLDKVIVVPTMQNPWKKNPPLPFDTRVGFIMKSTWVFRDKCEVSEIEKTIEAPHYSYKDCIEFRKKYPNDELYIICGTDVAKVIDKWKNYETDIKPYWKTLVVSRSILDVSSTNIRQRIKEGKEIFPLVTAEVSEAIKDLNLYK